MTNVIDTREIHISSVSQKLLDKMTTSAKNLHERLKVENYLTICNDELSSILRELTNVSEAKCFIIKEGFADHFILNINGARTLRSKLIKEQDYEHVHGPYRKPMNRIAIMQLDALISYMEEANEYI